MRPVERITLPDAAVDRLNFAQVREDPRLEIEALEPAQDRTVVIVGSGGCTALSLLAAGAGRVVAVDRNPVQNHVVELKLTAVRALEPEDAVAFLGGRPAAAESRRRRYAALRTVLSPATREWWDARPRMVAEGVIEAGVTERYIRAMAGLLRAVVHPRRRIERLLACRTLEEQREFYRREWDHRRWRMLFALLASRGALQRVYRPEFFSHAGQARFADHFRERMEHTLTELPVRENYFLHQVLAGHYPAGVDAARPPYLTAGGAAAVRAGAERLVLVDGGYTAYLATLPDASVDAFGLSNICEWMAPADVDALWREVARTARPGARLVLRNFVGWTEVPEAWAGSVVEDRERGAAMMRRDRSLFQRRFAPCLVHGRAA